MEFNERIAAARRAAGLTQEQLGERVGVTRQAVSKWEAGTAMPDALTAAKLCDALNVSADYLLLGKGETVPSAPEPAAAFLPDTCPCCGREVSGSVCTACGYELPTTPPRGPRYAIVAPPMGAARDERVREQLIKYCGVSEGEAAGIQDLLAITQTFALLRRGLDDRAALYIASHLDHNYFTLKIVEDDGEEDDALLTKPQAMETPPDVYVYEKGGIGFWGVVGAVIVALLLLSLF